MGISDTTALIAVALIFTYFLIYKKNRFIGNILFITIGVATTYEGSTEALYGIIIMSVGLLSFIYDTFTPKKKKGFNVSNLWTTK